MSLRIIGLVLAASLATGSLCAANEDTARDYLARGKTTAHLQVGDSRIERVEPERYAPAGAIVFQKFFNDIPLHGGRVTVIEEADGAVAQVYDDSWEHLQWHFEQAVIPAAVAAAMIETTIDNAVESDPKQVWFRTGNEAVLAWEVTTSLTDTGRPVSPTHLETVVDAQTGAVLSQRQIDTKAYAAGTPETAAGVFPRIVINNGIGAAGSRAYAAPFDAVVSIGGCTGTLIDEDLVLCARHCGVGAGATVVFGDNSNSGDLFRTVQSSFLPDGNGSLLDGGDVSILTLTATVPPSIATPVRLIDETDALEGMLCATLGYGYNGLGSNGHGFTSDGFRWGGENIIDVYGSPAGASGSNIISTDFDNGTSGANTIGGSSPTPVEFEATTAPGDSGGPVLVQVGNEWVIAGVLSGGTTSTSVYGDISWWTGTAEYRSAIESRGGEFVGDVDITVPFGLPTVVSPAGGDTLTIDAVASDPEVIVPGSGTLHINTGTGFQPLPLIQNTETRFTATFPATECLTSIEYYISFELESGVVSTLPAGAPGTTFSVLSAADLLSPFFDSFDTNLSWSVSGDATDGQWQRAIPNNGDRGDPEADAEPDGAGFCFVTDNDNFPDNNTDVDGGSTTVTSPVLNADGGAGESAFLSYYRWYSNDTGGAPNADTFVVEISNNGGASWVNLETVGPAGPGTSGGWIFVERRIDDVIAPTANMRVRFTASDFGDGSVIEAGVDAVAIRLLTCEDDSCVGDVDDSGDVGFNDLLTVLSAWGGTSPDLDGDGVVNFGDILIILANWGDC